MKKAAVLLTILICTFLSGCSESNTSNQQQVMNSISINNSNTVSNETVKTLKSDDSKTIVNVYTSLSRETGDNQKIEKIHISNGADSFTVSDVAGYYDNMQWVQGQPKVVIEYYGRTWRNFLIIDTENKKVLYKEPFSFKELLDSFIKHGASFNYSPNGSRPDVEFKYSKILDDDNIMINYKVRDEKYLIQSGSFIYSISKATFSELIQNVPISEG